MSLWPYNYTNACIWKCTPSVAFGASSPGGGAKNLAAPSGGSPAKRARGCIGWRSHLFSFYSEAKMYKDT